ncbi:unnamed protein product [Prorocentrum cordatum]|uniref:Uncharacterized protein n=1 Tax=Prorocentrum cordatum TaxID=2364126 RepID=A0ABN9V659_9DINO|nr:unnamed protein product [Polarella glacialis]
MAHRERGLIGAVQVSQKCYNTSLSTFEILRSSSGSAEVDREGCRAGTTWGVHNLLIADPPISSLCPSCARASGLYNPAFHGYLRQSSLVIARWKRVEIRFARPHCGECPT